ncbi:MAG: rhodanese-like domain-containing protein [Candidatus Doudnabacteria bacterium]
MNTQELEQAVSQVNAGTAHLLDVRRDEEWQLSHAKPAMHFDSGKILDQNQLPDLPKEATIYVYCQSGGRAGRVKNKLLAEGFLDVRNLGGLVDWQSVGGEVE